MAGAAVNALLEALRERAGRVDPAEVARGAASGWLGGIAGLPVDTLVGAGNLARAGVGYAGNKLGLMSPEQMPTTLDPAEVPMSSEWISKKFGVESPQAQAAETVFSYLSPDPAKLKKIGPAVAGLTAYHGSPHKFPPVPENPLGKFDSSKIGTGEGAQVIAHGHYLAEAPDTAKEYRRKLGGVKVRVGDTSVDDLIAKGGDTAAGARRLRGDFMSSSVAQHPDQVTDPVFWKETEDFYRKFPSKEAKKVVDVIDQYGPVSASSSGYLYKVDLPDEHIAKMLDWDAPLSKQPENVRAFFNENQAHVADAMKYYGLTAEDLAGARGKFLYELMKGEAAQTAGTLRAAGIPGVRYLDQGSRTKGEGTRNFVVFDDDIPKILDRE